MRKFRSITSAIDANVYVGPFGEIVVDDSGQLRIQDNVTAGGHLIAAETGNITFNGSIIDTTDPLSNITINSDRLTVANTIEVGNLRISNDTIVSESNVYIGAINQNTGTPFGILVDDGNIIVSGNVVPSGNVAYDLGSLENQWRHLYVSSNTIYIGGTPLTIENGNLLINGNTVIGGSVVTSELVNGNNIVSLEADGNLRLPAGGDIIDSTGTSVLGSAALGNYKIASGTIGTKDNPDTGGWGGYNIYLDPGGESSAGILIPSVSNQNTGSSLDIYNNANVNSAIHLGVNGGTYFFRKSELEVIHNASINQNNAYTRVTTPSVGGLQNSAVIWTALYDYVSSVKLTIQLETNQIGDATGWHSQVCEAIIASRGWANNTSGYGDPIMTVYGVTYTSTVPLATFTVQRNATTRMIEIVATRTAATDSGIDFRIHSVEMSSRD